MLGLPSGPAMMPGDSADRRESGAGLASFVSWVVAALDDRDLVVPKSLAAVVVRLSGCVTHRDATSVVPESRGVFHFIIGLFGAAAGSATRSCSYRCRSHVRVLVCSPMSLCLLVACWVVRLE